MTDNEKKVVDKIAALPESVKEKFLAMAEGAAIALESKGEKEDGRKDDPTGA